jgi:enterochelin esterase-like enzyme
MSNPGKSRRIFLGSCLGAAAVIAAGAAGVELVNHDVIPGKSELESVDGACVLPSANLSSYATPGPKIVGTFYSAARNRTVGYSIGYPPGHKPGDALPLVLMLHGEGGNYKSTNPVQAVALRVAGKPLPPMAMVTMDGGSGYWHAHPGDDPMRMLTSELIPMCRRRGLGTSPGSIAVTGVSMGGYGAILLGEKHPDLITAVATISPAVWTSYAQAKAVNAGAYTSAADFAANDVVTHTAALARIPVRVTAGYDDPFYPGVQALAKALPKDAVVSLSKGCHNTSFFSEQEPPSMAFLGAHLA